MQLAERDVVEISFWEAWDHYRAKPQNPKPVLPPMKGSLLNLRKKWFMVTICGIVRLCSIKRNKRSGAITYNRLRVHVIKPDR